MEKKFRLLLLLALLLTAVTGAWAQGSVDGTIVWPIGDEASATVSASIKDAISSTGVTTGSGLTVESATYLATNMVKYTPATANAGNVSGVMIEYRIEAVDGYKFKPTSVDYAAVKVGTDNISYSWSYTIDGVESAITDVSKDDVLRNNGSNSATAQLMHSESITADGCSVFTLRFYISKCSTGKNIGIGNITISGSVSAAPAGYTVSLKDGVKDADKWTVKVGEGQAQALPIGGLKGDGKETVTLQYNGRLKVKGVTATSDAAPAEQAVTTATPLTMECLTDGTIKVNMGSGTLSSGMQYAVNGGEKTTITGTTTIEGLTTGDKVQFYGVGTSTQVYGDNPEVKIAGGTATVKVYGNIMSLLDETEFATKTDLPNSKYVFYGLFQGNANLTDASGLLLPATTLAKYCYNGMFNGCTVLTAAPALPATTLASNCYSGMFKGCTALTAAPELPATTLASNCYSYMFYGCTKLASVTCKATVISASYCLNYWLSNAGTDASVTSRTLYVDPSMTSNTGWNNGNFTITPIPGN